MRIPDLALNLFLTTKTELYSQFLAICLITVSHSQIPGLNTEKSTKRN